jgi:hypothetical protein
MKTLWFTVVFSLATVTSQAMSFWPALAEIESGNNDYAVGTVGEISRYQIRPEIWQIYSSSKHYTDQAVALRVAQKHLAKLSHDFENATGHPPTEADCVVLWKSGITGYERRGFNARLMSAAHKDRLARFHNLRSEGTILVRTAPTPVLIPAPVVKAQPEVKVLEAKELEPFLIGPQSASVQTSGAFNKASGQTPVLISGAEQKDVFGHAE